MVGRDIGFYDNWQRLGPGHNLKSKYVIHYALSLPLTGD